MTPHAPQITARADAGRAAERAPRVIQDQTWGRPVFRPPSLGNPPIDFNPFPFRLHPFAAPRPARD